MVIEWPVLAGDRIYRVINGEARIGEPNCGAPGAFPPFLTIVVEAIVFQSVTTLLAAIGLTDASSVLKSMTMVLNGFTECNSSSRHAAISRDFVDRSSVRLWAAPGRMRDKLRVFMSFLSILLLLLSRPAATARSPCFAGIRNCRKEAANRIE